MAAQNIVRLFEAGHFDPIIKASSATLADSDLNHVITTTGGTGAVTLTLPAADGSKGRMLLAINTVNQNLIIASADEETLTFNDLTADSVAAQTTNEKIGAAFFCYCDGVKWAIIGITNGVTYTVASA